MNLKFKNFQNILIRNSEIVDNFIKKNLPKSEGLNKKLIQAIKYSILGSGKKIRSFLIVEAGKVISGVNYITIDKKKINELIVIASAIEAIHTYSLIHDDLPAMDNSDYRRGKKSTHKKFAGLLDLNIHKPQLLHFSLIIEMLMPAILVEGFL